MPVDAHGDATFWTAAIPDNNVQVNFAAGKAEMHVQNLVMEDYFKLPNALANGPEVDATVSFDVVWSGPVTRRLNVPDGSNGNRFAGEYVENQATVTWSGSNELGFRFTANPGDFSTSVPGRAFAELGHERNGIFVPQGSGNTNADTAPVLAALAARPYSAPLAPDGAGGAGIQTAPSPPPRAVSDGHAALSAQQTAPTLAPSEEPVRQTGGTRTPTEALDRCFAGVATGQDDLLLNV
jgi:hypothetical protein